MIVFIDTKQGSTLSSMNFDKHNDTPQDTKTHHKTQ